MNTTPWIRSVLVLLLATSVGLVSCGGDSDTEASSDTTASSAEDASADAEDEHADEENHEDEQTEDEHSEDDHDEDDHDDDVSAGLEAHEHGAAEMTLVWASSELLIELVSPAIDIFGFEHEPVSEEDIAQAAEQTAALSDAGILVVNAEAGCTLATEVLVNHEVEGSHSEVEASWLFACEQMDEIREVDATALFAQFPTMEDIDAQWVSPEAQSAGEISPSSPVLHLE